MLSDAQVWAARELGMSPAMLGKIDNHKQEPWKQTSDKYPKLAVSELNNTRSAG